MDPATAKAVVDNNFERKLKFFFKAIPQRKRAEQTDSS
tara:strand:+ start:1742 stop:1855 length:114 start_codon:yes stop_codon:yes gene_type:complete